MLRVGRPIDRMPPSSFLSSSPLSHLSSSPSLFPLPHASCPPSPVACRPPRAPSASRRLPPPSRAVAASAAPHTPCRLHTSRITPLACRRRPCRPTAPSCTVASLVASSPRTPGIVLGFPSRGPVPPAAPGRLVQRRRRIRGGSASSTVECPGSG